MIYNTPTKNEDGMYYVKALHEDKKKCLIQINDIKIVSQDADEITIALKNTSKVDTIDAENVAAAVTNSAAWFVKELSEDTIQSMYSKSIPMTLDIIPQTRVFNTRQELIDMSEVRPGAVCNVIVEFAGLWFAKKTFGATWNIVQVKIFDEPAYPENYAFQDDE